MPHKPQLDGLRCLAFLAVFVNHAWPEKYPWGGAGLHFFFALSGFLITRILLRAESGQVGFDLRRFYIRRSLRIFPLYYALVIGIGPAVAWTDLGWFLTYTYNIRAYLDTRWNDIIGHFWTLCVEEQFYLLYPLILLFTPSKHRVKLMFGLIVASKLFQWYSCLFLSMPWARLLLPYCGEMLVWGALAAWIDLRWSPGRHEGRLCFLIGLPILVLAWKLQNGEFRLGHEFQELVSTSCFGVGSSLVVFGAWRSSDRWIVWPLSVAPLAYLGRISYGLYAYHLPIMHGGWIDQIPYWFLVPRHPGELALTIALAALSWRYFERPILRWKDRFAPSFATSSELAEPRPSASNDRS